MTEAFEPDTRFSRKPVYAVLFTSETRPDEDYVPVVGQGHGFANFTVPHGLDRSVAEALPGLWYCIHLPNDLLELIDVPAQTLKRSQLQHLDHEIILAPIQVFGLPLLARWLESSYPILTVCPDRLVTHATSKSEELGFLLPVTGFSALSSDTLKAHWRAIHDKLVPDAPYLGREPSLSHRLDLAVTALPNTWLARQMGNDSSKEASTSGNRDVLLGEALYRQIELSAIARLEKANVPMGAAEELFPKVINEERSRMRTPVALALPGVAAAYCRRVYKASERARVRSLATTDGTDTWHAQVAGESDALIERSAIEFVTTHSAIARSGMGIVFPSVPQEAFRLLGKLEQHFNGGARGPEVWRVLGRLNDATESIWTDVSSAAVARASMLTVFTNFPIGLLRLPGDSEPLSSRIPIAYRPILPLTRAVQRELMYLPPIEIPEEFTVLVAECIPVSDPIGPYSRNGWNTTRNLIRSTGQPISFDIVETLSVDSLRTTIAERKPDFLVISAHGNFDPSTNVAGLLVGKEFSIGPDLGPMPPVVILSACNVAPRGTSAVSITDLLLREGAVAVLGTQVPVDVFHNATLMGRFFLYIRETAAKREDHSNLLEIWHRTQTTNAVIDIVNGSDSLRQWGYGTMPDGSPLLSEFMNVRSVGRLRNIYSDTETVLSEIADDTGFGSSVRKWLRALGYVPESLFYVFAGQPERIYLRPLTEAMKRYIKEWNV